MGSGRRVDRGGRKRGRDDDEAGRHDRRAARPSSSPTHSPREHERVRSRHRRRDRSASSGTDSDEHRRDRGRRQDGQRSRHRGRRRESDWDSDDDRQGRRGRSPARRARRREERESGGPRHRRRGSSSSSGSESDRGLSREGPAGQRRHASEDTRARSRRHREESRGDGRWGREAYDAKPAPPVRDPEAHSSHVSDDRATSTTQGASARWAPRRHGADQLDNLLEERRARSSGWLPVTARGGEDTSFARRDSRSARTTDGRDVRAVAPVFHVVLYGVERGVSAGHLRSLVEQLLGVRPRSITRPAKEAAVTARRADEAAHLVRDATHALMGTSSATTTAGEGYLDTPSPDEADDGEVNPADQYGRSSSETQGQGGGVLPAPPTAAAGSVTSAGVLLAPPQASRAVTEGLYDAAGPGGMVLLAFEERDVAQTAAARLHGAVLNGLQIAASVC